MSLTFTRAIVPEVGDTVTSTQMISFVRAINGRVRTFDSAWRILFYFYSWVRSVRVGTEFLTPSHAEFLEFFMHVVSGETWPEGEPGDELGANLANPAMAFVFGDGSVGSEQTRMERDDQGLNWLAGFTPTTALEIWETGAAQRGIIDPSTGNQNVPALQAAEAFYRIVQGRYSPFGRSYGGYLPIPEQIGVCRPEDPDTEPPTPNYRIFFTPLKEDLDVVEFDGTCPVGSPDSGARHVQFLAKLPFAYYIFTADGNVTRLAYEDYIEGPYTGGGVVAKTDGEHLRRGINAYLKDYRGSDAQRADPEYNVEDSGFDFERFLNSQYFLSPNIGHLDGEELVPDYPLFTFSGATSMAAGTLAVYGGGGTSHAYDEGYVLGGFFAQATGLQGACTIELLDGEDVIWTFTLTPGGGTGPTEPVVHWFESAVSPGSLKVRLKTGASFNPGGSLAVECTEQVAYKPHVHDAYLVIRLMSTIGQTDGMDNRGKDYTASKEISDAYFATGMLLNGLAPAPAVDATAVNLNPVFDSMRALVRDCVRVWPRTQLLAYAVESGKSVLYFRRYNLGLDDIPVDSFAGIAPGLDPILSGSIEAGVTYIVREASVVYNEVTVVNGVTFVGVAGVTAFTGSGTVLEREGLRAAARRNGTTNEWVMFEQLKAYHTSDSSIWKHDAYADIFAMSNRCQFYNQRINGFNHPELYLHASYGIGPNMMPEIPSGWNYAEGTQLTSLLFGDDRTNFYKSCRVYEPPPEMESATVEFWGETEVVKIVFKTRFRHCETAPGTVSADVSTWDRDALVAEPYRTMENGIREYLIQQFNGLNCQTKNGDSATFSGVTFLDGHPFGTCYPHFFAVHLVPEPHEDGNDTIDESTDTPAVVDPMIQSEIYLRAMCEGFVDGQTSADHGCTSDVTQMWDYTFENLCFKANGRRWISMMPEKQREDVPQGFGPLPNTIMYAEIFADMARAVNLLTRVRLLLPWKSECRELSYRGEQTVSGDWPEDVTCSSGMTKAVFFGMGPGAVASTDVEEPEWSECSSLISSAAFGIDQECAAEAGKFKLVTGKQVMQFRLRLVDPAAMNAVPEYLQELINDEKTGFFGLVEVNREGIHAQEVNDASEADGCPDLGAHTFFFAGGVGYKAERVVLAEHVKYCSVFSAGTLEVQMPPTSDLFMGRSAGLQFCPYSAFSNISVSFPGAQIPAFIEVPLSDL